MNKKGFTLVELLGVIVIMAVIIVLVSYNVVTLVQKTNSELDDASKKFLYTATEKYLDSTDQLRNGDYTVTVNQLISSDMISSTFLASQSQNKITKDSCVKANILNGKINYEFKYQCN